MNLAPLRAVRSIGFLLVALPGLSSTVAGAARTPSNPKLHATVAAGECTMVVPARRASVGVQMANASDFCELVSRALAGDVFRSSVVVTPGRLWHYTDATLSCRLRYRQRADWILIHNSVAACRWLTRPETAWHRESLRARSREQ